MSQQQQETGADNAQGWFILLGVGIALAFLVWYFAEFQIKNIIRWIRYGEIWIIDKVLDVWRYAYKLVMGEPAPPFTFTWNGQEVNFDESVAMVPKIPMENLDNPTISMISAMAMDPLKIPIMIIFGLIAVWCIFKGPRTHYRRKMGLDGLIKAQSKIFPVVRPFVEFDPSTLPVRPPGSPVPAELPSFSEALGPEEWLAYYNIPVPDGVIDEEAARKAFARQLGKRWGGPMRLEPYKQILLASFCLKAGRKRDKADVLLGRLAMCWSHKEGLQLKKDKTLLKEARKALKNKDVAGSTLAKCNQHAWENTALMRGLLNARDEGGVLAPAQFVWLRAYDRELWYPLNNLGRQALHMEALGAHAHYKMEKITQRPIPKPKVDDAVAAIREYMESDRARPIPALDYSGSKKRSIKKPT